MRTHPSRSPCLPRRSAALALQIAALYLATGCSSAQMAEAAPPRMAPAAAADVTLPPAPAQAPAPAAPSPPPPRAPATTSGKPRDDASVQQGAAASLIIYVGDLQMQVDEQDIPGALDKVIDVAESVGGYLAGRKDTSVQVRIPSQRFRDGLTRIEQIGDVLHRSVTADDVSEQVSDLEVRLSNLKATRARLQEFLARSTTMADMLVVEKELERVAAEIEQIEGKVRFLRSRAAFSLVTVAMSARPKVPVKVADKTPPPAPREVELPIDWLPRVGVDRLLNLRQR